MHKNSYLFILILSTTVFIGSTCLASVTIPSSHLVAEQRALELRQAPDPYPVIEQQPGRVAFSNSRSDRDYEQWQMGTTWYDCQNIGSAGKRVAWGEG